MGVLMENHHSFFCCLPKHMSWFIMIPNKYRASTWGWVMIEHGLDPRHTHMNVEPWARSGVISTSSLPLGCQGRGNTCFWAFGSSPKKHWSHQSDNNFKANPKNMYCFNCFVFFHYFRAIPLFVWIMTVYLEGEEEFLEHSLRRPQRLLWKPRLKMGVGKHDRQTSMINSRSSSFGPFKCWLIFNQDKALFHSMTSWMTSHLQARSKSSALSSHHLTPALWIQLIWRVAAPSPEVFKDDFWSIRQYLYTGKERKTWTKTWRWSKPSHKSGKPMKTLWFL